MKVSANNPGFRRRVSGLEEERPQKSATHCSSPNPLHKPAIRSLSIKSKGAHAPGFTLVELLLVVVLLGLLSSVAVPRLNRSVRSRELKIAADELTAAVATARTEAVRRGLKVRLTLDSGMGEYRLDLQKMEHSNREEYGPFGDGLLDARRTLPQGVTLEGLSFPGRPGNELVFEPTGLGEPRELRLVDASAGQIAIGIQEWYEQANETAPP